MQALMRSFSPWLLALLVAAVATSGCAHLLNRPEPPRVTLSGLSLAGADLFEQRYRVRLRVQNPNPEPLPIQGLQYTIFLNDQRFATGVSGESVTVPAFEERVVEVKGTSSMLDLIGQLRSLDAGAIRYRLEGGMRLADRGLRLPFEHKGEVSLYEGGSKGKP